MVFGFRSQRCFSCESSPQTGRYTQAQRGGSALCWWSQILLSRPINPELSRDKQGVRHVGGWLGETGRGKREGGVLQSPFHRESFKYTKTKKFLLVRLFEMTTNKTHTRSKIDFQSDLQTQALTKGPKEWRSGRKQAARVLSKLSILSFRGNRVNNCLNDDESIAYYQSVRKQRVVSLNWQVLFFLER